MRISYRKVEFISTTIFISSVTALIASTRSGILTFEATLGGGFSLFVLFCLFSSFFALAFTTKISKSGIVTINSMVVFQLYYLLNTSLNAYVLNNDYGTVNILSWVLFLGTSVILSFLFVRNAGPSNNHNFRYAISLFGIVFICFGLVALALGIESEILGLDDFQAQWANNELKVRLPVVTSTNAGAAFLAILCIWSMRYRLNLVLLGIVVGYLLYVNARIALIALACSLIFNWVPLKVQKYLKWPILLFPIYLVPIILFFSDILPDPSSVYGTLNGRAVGRATSSA